MLGEGTVGFLGVAVANLGVWAVCGARRRRELLCWRTQTRQNDKSASRRALELPVWVDGDFIISLNRICPSSEELDGQYVGKEVCA